MALYNAAPLPLNLTSRIEAYCNRAPVPGGVPIVLARALRRGLAELYDLEMTAEEVGELERSVHKSIMQ